MSRHKRIPKTIYRKITDLEDHLYLLNDHLQRLDEAGPHIKVVASELRLLICFSSKTEGLLWRLMDELRTSDNVVLHVSNNVDKTQPLSVGLVFSFDPLEHPKGRDPALVPKLYSYREIIKSHEPVFVRGSGITHESLIKIIAQQIGSSHEDDRVDLSIVDLESIIVQGIKPYVPILKTDAELTIEIGNRVIDEAEKKLGYVRKHNTILARKSVDLTPRSNNKIPDILDYGNAGTSIEPEGTMAFRLIHDDKDWAINNKVYKFGTIRMSTVIMEPTKYPDGTIEFKFSGIFGKMLSLKYVIPPCEERGLLVGITWKYPNLKIYMNSVEMGQHSFDEDA